MELTILALLMVLVAAWSGGTLATRIGYPAVLGELVAGILLGPAILGLLGDGSWLTLELGIDGSYQSLNIIGQVGVLLMMLYIGMEIDPKELGKASWAGFLAAIGGFITPFAMGFGVVLAFGGTPTAAVFVGIAVGVTSLATKSRILLDLKILDTRIAHVMLAGALIADTLALLVFAGVLGFADSETLELMAVVRVGARAVMFFGIATLLGLYVLPLLFKQLQKFGIKNRGVYFTLMLLIALAFGEGAEIAGLHAILGTFVAGLFLQEGMLEPKLNRELNDLVREISVGFLAPVFFVMAGFHVSLDVFTTDLWFFVAIMAVAFVGKIVGTALFYIPTGFGWREGVVLGAGMNGRGAVEIIIAGIGLQAGLITPEIFSILVFMAVITTASVPLFLKWGTNWLQKRGELVRSTGKRNTVLIVGATPTARALALILQETQPVWLVDSNPARVKDAQAAGLNAVVGNALENETLAEAHAPAAKDAVTMTSNVEINVLAARQLRDVFMVPDLQVLVRGPGPSADLETFEHLGASMLFGKPVSLNDWDHWFSRGSTQFERVAARAGKAADVLRQIEGDAPSLVLAVETEVEGVKKVQPFQDGLEVKDGDTLIVARARTAAQLPTDRFDEIVRSCRVLDFPEELNREQFFQRAAMALGETLEESAEQLTKQLIERESLSSTVLTAGLAVPHIILAGKGRFELLIVRCREGVVLEEGEEPAHALFVLAASADQRNFHLKALSAIAQIWQSPDFEGRWRNAQGEDELRKLLIDSPRQRTA